MTALTIVAVESLTRDKLFGVHVDVVSYGIVKPQRKSRQQSHQISTTDLRETTMLS